MNKKNSLMIIKVAMILLVLSFVLMDGNKQIKGIDFAKTIMLIRSLPKSYIFIFFCFGIIGSASMTLYDFIIAAYLKLKIKPLTIFNISFVANTINNISGLGGLTASSIRTVLFKKNSNDAEDTIKYSLLIVPATGVGLSILSVLSVIKYEYLAPIIQQHKWLILGLILFIGCLIFYYFIPLAIGAIFTLATQLKSENYLTKLMKKSRISEFADQTSSITNLLLSILIFSSGAVLLISALIPGMKDRIKIAAELLSFPILQWSHQLSICIGILLIAISREIRMKVKRAYKITFYLLLFGALFTFLKGLDYEEAIFIGLVLLLHKMSEKSFYRKSIPFNWLRTIIGLIVGFVGIAIYVKLAHVIHLDFLKRYHFSLFFKKGALSSVQSVIIAYSALVTFLIIWQWSKKSITEDARYEELDEEKITKFLGKYEGHYLTHLIYLKDKHLFWAASNQVVIIYEKSHHLIIALGDPIGDSAYFSDAIAEFQNFINEYGYKAAFYQVSEKFLPTYHDHGYYFFKLGELAIINLNHFELIGSKNRDFRNVLSRFHRNGYVFETFPALPENLFPIIKQVSDEWLEGRKEMRFSLGFFDRDYLEHSPIAAVKKVDTNEIIAFASIIPSYDHNQSASIDLMRFKKDIPNNTMTFLILNLLMKYKEDGYELFNLGMAPLANVGKTQNAHLSEKMAHLLCQHGKNFYSFDGLRKYKDKFDPTWSARYLAYEEFTLLPTSLIEATLLIHSNKIECVDKKEKL